MICLLASSPPKALSVQLANHPPWAQGDMGAVRTIVESGLDVFAHNIETVQRLQVRCAAGGRRAADCWRLSERLQLRGPGLNLDFRRTHNF